MEKRGEQPAANEKGKGYGEGNGGCGAGAARVGAPAGEPLAVLAAEPRGAEQADGSGRGPVAGADDGLEEVRLEEAAPADRDPTFGKMGATMRGGGEGAAWERDWRMRWVACG